MVRRQRRDAYGVRVLINARVSNKYIGVNVSVSTAWSKDKRKVDGKNRRQTRLLNVSFTTLREYATREYFPVPSFVDWDKCCGKRIKKKKNLRNYSLKTDSLYQKSLVFVIVSVLFILVNFVSMGNRKFTHLSAKPRR